MVALGKDTHVL